MIKQFSLLLLIFLFLTLIYYFSTPSPPIENFIDKSNEKQFILKDRTFTYNDKKDDKITINSDYTFTSPLNKAVVSKLSNLKYNYTINNLKCIIDISYNDNPIKINVNDYNYIIDIKKSIKYEGTLNIFIYDKICGSISNNVMKTNFYEIYDDVAIIGVIFLSFLLYKSIEDFEAKDYDKHFSSSAPVVVASK
jgi:hypothetical protein